jgi:osmotically inducible protein OsmC
MPIRRANARWEGNLVDGRGTMHMQSGSYEGPYSFQSRFEEGEGTNPEELIAAAHAGCFSMKFSADLSAAGFEPESVETTANVHLDQVDDGFKIARSVLETRAKVPGIPDDQFQEIAQAAKDTCPVSAALGAIDLSVEAELVE